MAAAEEALPAGRLRGGRLVALLVAYRYPLLVGIASRVLVLAAFAAIAAAVETEETTPARIIRLIGSWDGVWYRRIATVGYDPGLAHGNTPAFFPLWPAILHGLHALAPGAPLAALGSLVAQALFLVALCVVYRLIGDRLGVGVARRAVLYTAFFPTAHAFTAVYTESLFLLTTATAFLLAERGRYGAAAVAGALATLTRPTGVLLAPALVLHALHADGYRVRWRTVLRLAPLVLLPIALLAFQLYLGWRTGLTDATRLAQERGWGRGFTPLLVVAMPVAGVAAVVEWLRGQTDAATIAYASAASLWAWLLLWAARARAIPPSWWLFAAGVVTLPVAAGTYVAVPRYGMGAFPLMALLALVTGRRAVHRAVAVALPLGLLGAMAWTYGLGVFTP